LSTPKKKNVLNRVSPFLCSWESPNKQGIGCNTLSPDDSANFLAFLQELREQPAGQDLILSAAVTITPFVGADGNPMDDVSDFAKVLNYIGEIHFMIIFPMIYC
jgi:chitinase